MSVVNRMLQDIDRRRAAAAGDTTQQHGDVRAAAPMARSSEPKRSMGVPIWGALALLALLAVAIAWVMSPTVKTVTTTVSATTVSAKPTAPVAVVAAQATPDTVATNVVTAGTPPPIRTPLASAERLKLSMQLSALVAAQPSPAPSEPAKRAADTATALTPAAAPAAVPASPAPLPGKTTITTVPVRQVASDETIISARQLWSDGARASALTTLRDALAAAEAARNQRATAPLARELARLEVADNRPQVALDLLKRLENLLAEDADAWALRGNAEQRLGLHADAAQSHLIALRIRPTEGKWMIGAAISLAALGKLDEAQMWAERARERDAVTPAIAAYLQQLGITARR